MSCDKAPSSSLSRRVVLKGGLAVAGTLATATAVDAAQTAACEHEISRWTEMVGKTFVTTEQSVKADALVANDSSPSYQVTLCDVATRDHSMESARPNHLRRKSISLLFRSGQRINSSNICLAHPELGNCELLVSMTRELTHEAGKYVYEAVLS